MWPQKLVRRMDKLKSRAPMTGSFERILSSRGDRRGNAHGTGPRNYQLSRETPKGTFAWFMQSGNLKELKKHFLGNSEGRFREYSIPVVVSLMLQAGFLLC